MEEELDFWEDVWCGENPLRVTFRSSLYLLADSKGAMAAEVWDSTRGEGAWNPNFVRPFNDWELDIVQRFIGTINNKKVNMLEKDNLSWKIDGKGSFTIKVNFTPGGRNSHFCAHKAVVEQLCPPPPKKKLGSLHGKPGGEKC